jgi:hypothetical protein
MKTLDSIGKLNAIKNKITSLKSRNVRLQREVARLEAKVKNQRAEINRLLAVEKSAKATDKDEEKVEPDFDYLTHLVRKLETPWPGKASICRLPKGDINCNCRACRSTIRIEKEIASQQAEIARLEGLIKKSFINICEDMNCGSRKDCMQAFKNEMPIFCDLS